ncbi:MAG: hypothetical protein EOO10_00520 [Chitinophagaceae bacterium]|nr:MAG: hypothetical protein EOO10_00520 [Chitinophagaceae bacterium]
MRKQSHSCSGFLFFLTLVTSVNFMRRWLIGLFLLCQGGVHAQLQTVSFTSIDWKMRNTEAPTPDSLARFIASNYTTQLEKVRAAYSWITSHIGYNTGMYKPGKVSVKYPFDPMDTAAIWPSGDEMVARKVMLRKEAVCDGYSKLFKVICTYAGVEAVVVQGYGRTTGMGSQKFRTNHTWNAVRIDSAWYLLDVTWASGYINFRDEFVSSQNDEYFLTPPGQFIQEHYPEDLRWTLLSQPPTVSEFKKMPFRSKNFIKYDFMAFSPSGGVIEAAVGDTISFSLQVKSSERRKRISPDSFVDTASFSTWPLSAFIKPENEKGNDVYYSYIVQPGREWVNLIYNDDVVMRYRVNVVYKNAETLVGN